MTITNEFELKQLKIDLAELKDQVVKLKQAESSYASELATFRTNYQRLSKYFHKMSENKKNLSAADWKEISEVLEGIDRSRPMKAHWLLQLLLGNQLTYKLLTPSDRLAFKKSYENFKIITTLVHLCLSFIGIFFLKRSNLYDGFIPLYTVVVYWIIIGREAVLKMNGSNIRGWWFAHHILSMLLSAVMIIWDKNSQEYFSQIRSSLFCFYFYIGAVQILQYRYQMSRLYALRSLSRVDPMETTNELAQNLIHHNLLFLLPFLSIAYAFEFYLAYLFWIHTNGPATLTISVLYFVLASGNTLTTCYTYYRKISNCRILSREDEGKGRHKNLLVRQFTKSSEDLNLIYKNNNKKIKEDD